MRSYLLKIIFYSLILCIRLTLHGASHVEHSHIPSLATLCIGKILEHNIPYTKNSFEHAIIHQEVKKKEARRLELISDVNLTYSNAQSIFAYLIFEVTYNDLTQHDQPWNRDEGWLERNCRILAIKAILSNEHSLLDKLMLPLGTLFTTFSCYYCGLIHNLYEAPSEFFKILGISTCSLIGTKIMRKCCDTHRAALLNRCCCSTQWRSHLDAPRAMIMEEDEIGHEKID